MRTSKIQFPKRFSFFFLLFCILGIMGYARSQQNTIFHAVVAKDGTGDYTTVQSAIDAVPENLKSPWLIFVKNGSYEEQVIIPQNKPFIHLIGQDKERTIIHLELNVGGKPDANTKDLAYWHYSVHNPKSAVSHFEGAVVNINASDFYSENISYVNDWGLEAQNGPQALALKTKADRIAFYNCKFRSFQDTWMTTTRDADRHYVKECWLEGAVDYFYGGGNALVEESTLYNVRSGSVIVAPCHESVKYGYVFRNCVIDGNEQAADGKLKLGRPWHNSPKAVYINTLVKIPLAPEGWTNMGTIPALFAEYNSMDMNGKTLDLSCRKTEYETGGKEKRKGECRATITSNEAALYTYENIIKSKDGWDPRSMMEQLPAPAHIRWEQDGLKWDAVPGALGYVLDVNGKIVDITSDTQSLWKSDMKGVVLLIRAVNRNGTLGEQGVCYL